MQLFIDTNIYLAFYQLTSEDLEELNKLIVLIEKGDVTLYVTNQVCSELSRNREIKIAEAINRLREQHLNLQFPQMCKDYPEYALLRDHQKLFEDNHATLIKALVEDSERNRLKADKTIDKLFTSSKPLETTPQIVSRARLRIDIGNPPGKNGSLGDAISWELLLEKLPKSEDLFFITGDRDYSSPLSKGKFREFLLNEWHSIKNSDLFYYERLSHFFKDRFPQIKLATELEKNFIIQRLASSPNFATTHSLVARLQNFSEFTPTEVNAIVTATLSNKQITWIANDGDVQEFLQRIIESFHTCIDADSLAKLHELLSRPATLAENDCDFPPI